VAADVDRRTESLEVLPLQVLHNVHIDMQPLGCLQHREALALAGRLQPRADAAANPLPSFHRHSVNPVVVIEAG
jgi:hypothetical protein